MYDLKHHKAVGKVACVLDGRLDLFLQRSLVSLRGLLIGRWHPQKLSVGMNPAQSDPCSPSLCPLCSMPQDLSEALKEATKEVHTQAENAEFMKNFQKGQVTRKGFKVCGLAGSALVECMKGVGVPEALRPVV